MGFLEWLGLRRKKTEPQQQVQVEKEVQKPAEWKLPREDIRLMSDSEKINLILQGVFSVYEELKPLSEDGSRVSRLELVLDQLSVRERAKVRKVLDDLDIDEHIVGCLDAPKRIEEVAAFINKSYGYTAARLRYLKRAGRVTRIREPGLNKYKYARMSEGEAIVQKTLENGGA